MLSPHNFMTVINTLIRLFKRKPTSEKIDNLCTKLNFHFLKTINYFYGKTIEFFSLNEISEKKKVISIIKKDNKIIKIFGQHFIYFSDMAGNIKFIIFSLEAIKEILEYINNNKFDELIDNSALEYLITSLRTYSQENKNNLEEIISKFHTVTMTNNYIVLHKKINIEKYIIGFPPELIDLPDNLKTSVNSIKINKSYDNKILSVELPNVIHANVKDGFLCIGNLRNSEMTITNIQKVFQYIKYFNMNDCYYTFEQLTAKKGR